MNVNVETTYKQLLNFERELLYHLLFILHDVHKVLHYIFILPNILCIAFGCKMLDLGLQVINELGFLGKLHIERSDLCVGIHYD